VTFNALIDTCAKAAASAGPDGVAVVALDKAFSVLQGTLLLLYSCFTHALLMLYSCFIQALLYGAALVALEKTFRVFQGTLYSALLILSCFTGSDGAALVALRESLPRAPRLA
jgi:hypothetical protein